MSADPSVYRQVTVAADPSVYMRHMVAMVISSLAVMYTSGTRAQR